MSEMQITTEELEDYKLKVVYVADADVVKEKNKKALDELRKLRVPGFRPGKATDLALKTRFKDHIDRWVKSEMLTHANDDIVFETKIDPIGAPHFESVNLNGNSFKMQVVYNKKPKFELSQYKGLEIPEPHIEKTVDEKVNEFLQQLRTKHADVRPYEDADFVQEGDKVTLEYELGDGTKEEGKLYEVGSKLFEEFDENLFGMSAGETREFDILVGGERTNCKVTVHMGLKSVPCPLDETLAQRCGVANLEEVTNSVKQIAENHVNGERNEKIAKQVRAKLLEMNQFDPPQWLVNNQFEYSARQQGLVVADLTDDVREKLMKQASDEIRFNLIIDAIRKVEPEVELAEEEAISAIRQQLFQRGAGPNVDNIIDRARKDGSINGFIDKMKNDYTIQWIIDNANVQSGFIKHGEEKVS